MNVSILAGHGSHFLKLQAAWLQEGYARHGHTVEITPDVALARGDLVVTWGWRNGQRIKAGSDRNVLVMERGYIGDRFHWTSLGWNGLNGRAKFPEIDDPSRFAANFRLAPWKESAGRVAVFMAQVPRDAALANVNYASWATQMIRDAQRAGWDVRVRLHPKGQHLSLPGQGIRGTLEEALVAADLAITYNSNAGVDAVLAGVPAIAVDSGSMAWDVTGRDFTPIRPAREQWAARLAWKQWAPEEIRDGAALDHVMRAMP